MSAPIIGILRGWIRKGYLNPTTKILSTTGISGASIPGKKGFFTLEVSFESGEQTTHKIYFPIAVKIVGLKAFVTKALSGTDDGTITPKDNAGTTMTEGTITLEASSAVGTEASATPTANNVINADQKLQLTVAKTTAGGKARVTVWYEEL